MEVYHFCPRLPNVNPYHPCNGLYIHMNLYPSHHGNASMVFYLVLLFLEPWENSIDKSSSKPFNLVHIQAIGPTR